LNNPIFYLIQSLRTATFDTFFVLVSLFFSPSIMIFLGIILGMLLLLKNRRRDAAHLLGALAITVLLLGFFRWWLYSPRPLGFMILKESSSFPSGHTLLSLIVLSLGTYFLNQNTVSVQWRWLTRCCAGILILFVAVSRIYLGQHWLTDLLAAFFLGSSILLFTLVNYRRMPKIQAQANFPWYTWALALCLAWLIPGTVDAGLHYKKLHYATTPYSVEFHINMEQWWQSPFEYLPLFRNNRFGHPMLPFNLQWAQPLPAIKTLLEKAGWKEINHKKPTVTSTIRRLASSDPEFHMPIFQWLYLNQPPALVMIRRLSNSKAIMELRLWQTNVHFLDSDVPLWIGTVNLHYPPHRILGIDTEKQTIVFAPPEVTAALQGDLQGAQVKIIQTDEQQLPPEKLKSNHWNRQVILVR
jgi:membrane-associated phospholipid phosphatase